MFEHPKVLVDTAEQETNACYEDSTFGSENEKKKVETIVGINSGAEINKVSTIVEIQRAIADLFRIENETKSKEREGKKCNISFTLKDQPILNTDTACQLVSQALDTVINTTNRRGIRHLTNTLNGDNHGKNTKNELITDRQKVLDDYDYIQRTFEEGKCGANTEKEIKFLTEQIKCNASTIRKQIIDDINRANLITTYRGNNEDE